MLNPLSNVIGISVSSSMEAKFILAVAPPVIFKICFPFRNSFLLSRSSFVSFSWPFTILVFISGHVKTVKESHNTPSFMPASAMFDLRKKYFGIRGKPDSVEIKKIKLAFLFFSDFSDRRVGETIFIVAVYQPHL